MSIAGILRDRQIGSVVHFTTNRGLVGALAVGALLSRWRLPSRSLLEYVLHVNAARRPEAAAAFDKSENWLDYVNLSISEVNSRFLEVSKRWHNADNVWWCVLEFDSSIMTHEGVFFATTNNAYELCERGRGVAGLKALFVPKVRRKNNWSAIRGRRASNLPTCEQAEVLYPESVDVEYLRRIYVEEGDQYDVVGGWLQEFDNKDVEVVVSPEKFGGQRN